MTKTTKYNIYRSFCTLSIVAALIIMLACGGGGGGGDSSVLGTSDTSGDMTGQTFSESIVLGDTVDYQVPTDGITGTSYSFSLLEVAKTNMSSSVTVREASSSDPLLGATINSRTGKITWSPTEKGVYELSVKITNDLGRDYLRIIVITVILPEENTPPVIEAIGTQNAVPGVSFTLQVTATDPHTPLSYELGAAPEGMTISSGGLISWTPTGSLEGNETTVGIKVSDRYGKFSTYAFKITLASENPAIDIIPDQTAAVGSVKFTYDHVVVTENNPPITLSLVNNPAGMIISKTGVISWTPASEYAGTTMVITVKATDSLGNTGTRTFNLSVDNLPPAVLDIPERTAPSGSTFEHQVVATDANTPLVYTLPTAPSGMTIGTGGKISWLTGSPGTSPVTVKVTDALGSSTEKSFNVTVTNDDGPIITPIADQTASVNTEAVIAVVAADANTPLTYALVSGAPTGMTIDSAAGIIRWTPTSSDEGLTYNNVTFRVTDIYGAEATGVFNISVTNTPPVVTAISDQTFNTGVAFNHNVAASDNSLPLTYQISNQPTGMTIDGNGHISFITPVSLQGTAYNVTVRVTDAHPTDPKYTDVTFAFTINNINPTFAAIADQMAVQNKIFTLDIAPYVSDPNTPFTFTITNPPSMTPPMTISSDGYISWIPTSSGGPEAVTVKVTDSAGGFTERSFNITVDSTMGISTSQLPDGAVNGEYFFRLAALGGVLPHSWSVQAGSLPSGLSLEPDSGIIYGAPSSAGDSTFTIRLTDSNGVPATRDKEFTITVNLFGILTETNLPAPTIGYNYSVVLNASGGTAPYTFAIESGYILPSGMTLSSDGILFGAAETAGDYYFSIKVTDSASATATKMFAMTVNDDGAMSFNHAKASPGRYYYPVNLTGSSSDLTNFQVKVEVPYSSGMQQDFDDIRFYADSLGTIPLPFWLEKTVSTGPNIAREPGVTGTQSTYRNAGEEWYKVIDGTSSYWCAGVDCPQWVELTFPINKTINRVYVWHHENPNYTPRDYQIQTWNGSSWDTQITETGNAIFKWTYTFQPVTTNKVRLYITNDNGAPYPVVNEIEVYEAYKETAVFWVNVPSIPTTGQTIYMYYGDDSATSASDGDATFEFFDDFSSGDLSKWEVMNGGSFSVVKERLRFNNTGTDNNYLRAKTEIGASGFVIETTMGSNFTTGNGHTGIMWHANDSTGANHRNDFVYLRPHSYNTDQNIQPAYYDGSSIGFGNTLGLYRYAIWHDIKIELPSANSVKYYLDGVSAANWANQQYQANTYVGVMAHNSYESFWDNYRVRKYANPEPVASIGAKVMFVSSVTEETASTTQTADGVTLGKQNLIGGYYFSKRAPVAVTGSGSDQTDFQIRVNVTYDADMQADFDDIRFLASNEKTELPYWRESYVASTSAIFWVKVDSIPIAGTTIYMYYGNSSVSSTSDGSNVFEFFDDFETGSVANWSKESSTIVPATVDGASGMNITPGGSNYRDVEVYRSIALPSSYIVESRMKDIGTGEYPGGLIIVFQDTGHWLSLEGSATQWTERGENGEDVDTSWLNAYMPNIIPTGWQKQRIDIIGDGTYKIWIDDTMQAQKTIPLAFTHNGIGFGKHTGYSDIFIDWVFLRKYASPEPTTTPGAEEAVPEIFVASSGSITTCTIEPASISAWGSITFSDLKSANGGPSGTDVKYQIKYWDGDSWELIPDLDLSGQTNSSGIGGTAPIDISMLNLATNPEYEKIRVVAILSTADSSTSPRLYNVSISWTP